jgi:hypothetical protein
MADALEVSMTRVLDKAKERRRTRKWRRYLRANGLCVCCAEPSVNRTHCDKHRKAHNAYLLLWRKGRKKAEHDD